MATTAFTIYSHYDPSQREQLELETGQIQEAVSNDHGGEEEPTTVWEAEAFKARKKAPPPRFVKATMDGWSTVGSGGGTSTPSAAMDKNDVAGWYRSLTQTRSSSSSSSPGLEANGKSETTVVKEVIQKPVSPSSSLGPSAGKGKGKQPRENNWFIQKVLQQSQSDSTGSPPSSSSLADILARDPPPRPASGDKFHPPVFLALGPSNKGYALLENSGWTEGEALGPDVVRAQKEGDRKRKGLGSGAKRARITKEVDLEGGDGEVKEVVPVIDLTVSDSSGDEGDGDGVAEEAMGASDDEHASDSLQQGLKTEDSEPSVSFVASSAPSSSNPIDRASARTALITPIPTILKSDRLGIGLKAKTVGPYKSSMKRITHNSAALAAHLQRAEDAKKRREKHGRGHRSFARQYKEEQRWRSDMQAYMNS